MWYVDRADVQRNKHEKLFWEFSIQSWIHAARAIANPRFAFNFIYRVINNFVKFARRVLPRASFSRRCAQQSRSEKRIKEKIKKNTEKEIKANRRNSKINSDFIRSQYCRGSLVLTVCTIELINATLKRAGNSVIIVFINAPEPLSNV